MDILDDKTVDDFYQSAGEVNFVTHINLLNTHKIGDVFEMKISPYVYYLRFNKIFKYNGSYKIFANIVANPLSITIANALRKEKLISVSEYANKYHYLDQGAAIPGRYSTDIVPFLVEIMDNFCEKNGITETWIMKGAQLGLSELGNVLMAYIMDLSNANTMIVFPTRTTCEEYSHERITPLMDLNLRIKKKFENHKPSDNKRLYKRLPIKGSLSFASAGNGNDLRSKPKQYLILDEIDGYGTDVEGEGDPVDLAITRTETFEKKKKIFGYSTPTADGFSKIQSKFLTGDQRYWNITCPHCQEYIVLDFKNFMFEENPKNKEICIPDSISYECQLCHKQIYEKDKKRLVSNGKWIPTNLDAKPGVRSYQLGCLISLFISWESIINKYLAAKNDINKLKAFTNVVLGMPYKMKSSRPVSSDVYNRRSSFKEWTCPSDVVEILMGVDTQDDRFEATVVGIGSDNKIYVIAHEIINGDPQLGTTQEQLLRISNRKVLHGDAHLKDEDKVKVPIKQAVIDSGGHRTSAVYDFCRENKKFIPIKGSSSYGKSYAMKRSEKINTDSDGNSFDFGFDLYSVNTVFMKEIIYQCINNKDNPESNYIFFNNDLKPDYFDMICSEEMVEYYSASKNMRMHKFVPIKQGMRNEALDCLVYAIALQRTKGLHLLIDETYKEHYNLYILPLKEKQVDKVEIKKGNVPAYSRFTRR